MEDAEVDHHRGHNYDGSEISVRTRAFYCSKRRANLYSFGFDRHIDSFEPAMMDEGGETIRMPDKIGGCEHYEGYLYE